MELFDTGRNGRPEKPKSPTAPQMRFLHMLSQNVLEIKSRPLETVWLKTPEGDHILWNFHPVVANNVVMNGWATMKSFAKHKAEYRISTEGREALKELCEHAHNPHLPESSELLAGNLLCKKCARSVRCRSKQPTTHGANAWHDRFGPICNACLKFLSSV